MKKITIEIQQTINCNSIIIIVYSKSIYVCRKDGTNTFGSIKLEVLHIHLIVLRKPNKTPNSNFLIAA